MASSKIAHSDFVQMLQDIEEILTTASKAAAEAAARMLAAQKMLKEAHEQHQKAEDEIRAAQKVKVQFLSEVKSGAERDLESFQSECATPSVHHDAETHQTYRSSRPIPTVAERTSNYTETASTGSLQNFKKGSSPQSKRSKYDVHRSPSGGLELRRPMRNRISWTGLDWK